MASTTKREEHADARESQEPEEERGITRLTVSGFKSLSQEQSIEIRPLTLLAGANSSGKSSIMQPVLLMKQTLEASYDPGPLLLHGPNLKFTSVDELLAWTRRGKRADTFSLAIEVGSDWGATCTFQRRSGKGLELRQTTYSWGKEKRTLRLGMTDDEIAPLVRQDLQRMHWLRPNKPEAEFEGSVVRKWCFLQLAIKAKGTKNVTFGLDDISPFTEHILHVIHLPGLRGNPERTYSVSAVGPAFAGTFEKYMASVIAQWEAGDKEELGRLCEDLRELGLTWKVTATAINDTQVELRVGRLSQAARGGGRDLVNIADVGFGVSQTLPVLVALQVAAPEQLVYLEQPEIHLHPRAQVAMAQVLANAAIRGVRVVAETHSHLLLLGVQALVAEGKLAPELVKLHWFRRRDDGTTEVTSTDLDEAGAFGDWPEDFADVALRLESRYLDAAEARQRNS